MIFRSKNDKISTFFCFSIRNYTMNILLGNNYTIPEPTPKPNLTHVVNLY